MREIVLDTETTGLDPDAGHRIIEVGCVELVNRIPSGQIFHQLIDPERDVPEDAVRVHGIDNAKLAGKPKFADVVGRLLSFLGDDDKLVIHNAAFDVKFLNAEFAKVGAAPIVMARVIDTIPLARRRHPGSPVNLDALCKRYNIDLSGREKHGALLDSELLARVYIELLGGSQTRLDLASTAEAQQRAKRRRGIGQRPEPLPPRLTEADVERHRTFVETLGPNALWLKYLPKTST